jgi:hypothetical protein
MSTYDSLTTQALQEAQEGCGITTKPLFRLEPERRIELLTYALRVRCSTD